MANFSSGSGYFATISIFVLLAGYLLNTVVSIPFALAASLKENAKGLIRISVLKKALRIYIPIAILAAAGLAYLNIDTCYLDGVFGKVFTVVCAVLPFLIVYLAIKMAIRKATVNFYQGEEEKIKASALIGYSFLYVFLFSLVPAAVGLLVYFLVLY